QLYRQARVQTYNILSRSTYARAPASCNRAVWRRIVNSHRLDCGGVAILNNRPTILLVILHKLSGGSPRCLEGLSVLDQNRRIRARAPVVDFPFVDVEGRISPAVTRSGWYGLSIVAQRESLRHFQRPMGIRTLCSILTDSLQNPVANAQLHSAAGDSGR